MKTSNAWKKLNQPISETGALGKHRPKSFVLWFAAGATALFWVALCYHLGWSAGSKATLVSIALLILSFLTMPRSKVKFQAFSDDRKQSRKR